MRQIVITGHEGYIGSVLTDAALQAKYSVIGLDSGFYRESKIGPQGQTTNLTELELDLRHLEKKHLDKYELEGSSVIHLAGLSNDPLGEFDEKLTYDINFHASKKLIDLCKARGVSRFIFFSTQSVYGISSEDHEITEDEADRLNPVTAYAKSKLMVEQYLRSCADESFQVVIFRPSTVFGPSRSFRSDIVFNNLTMNAYLTGTVTVKSDGSPWRPIISVNDVARAALEAIDKSLGSNIEVYNLGFPGGNFQVRDMAETASKFMNASGIVYLDSLNEDPRTYQVCFDKFARDFSSIFLNACGLEEGGTELKNFYDALNFRSFSKVKETTTRLAVLKKRIDRGDLNMELFAQ